MIAYGWRMEDGVEVPDKYEMGVLAVVAELRKEGRGYKAITREVNRRGLRNRHGRPFGYDSIKNFIVRYTP